MTKRKILKPLEITVTGITTLIIILTIITYILDQNKSNWACGPLTVILELFAIGIQSFLTLIAWLTTSKKLKTFFVILSAIIFGFIVYLFIQFNLKCS